MKIVYFFWISFNQNPQIVVEVSHSYEEHTQLCQILWDSDNATPIEGCDVPNLPNLWIE